MLIHLVRPVLTSKISNSILIWTNRHNITIYLDIRRSLASWFRSTYSHLLVSIQWDWKIYETRYIKSAANRKNKNLINFWQIFPIINHSSPQTIDWGEVSALTSHHSLSPIFASFWGEIAHFFSWAKKLALICCSFWQLKWVVKT